MAARSITAAVVAGNAAVTTPESSGLVAEADPATVKKFSGTPVKVYPAFGVSVMVAVYAVTEWNGLCTGDQIIAPVY